VVELTDTTSEEEFELFQSVFNSPLVDTLTGAESWAKKQLDLSNLPEGMKQGEQCAKHFDQYSVDWFACEIIMNCDLMREQCESGNMPKALIHACEVGWLISYVSRAHEARRQRSGGGDKRAKLFSGAKEDYINLAKELWPENPSLSLMDLSGMIEEKLIAAKIESPVVVRTIYRYLLDAKKQGVLPVPESAPKRGRSRKT
jgi:hypothetical protein